MKCIGTFRNAYGQWPTDIEVSDGILRSLIDVYLTPLGFFDLQRRLRIREAPEREEEWILVRSDGDHSYNYTYGRFGGAAGNAGATGGHTLDGVAEWLGWDLPEGM